MKLSSHEPVVKRDSAAISLKPDYKDVFVSEKKSDIVVVLPFPARNGLIDLCLQKTLSVLPDFVNLLILPDAEEEFDLDFASYPCSITVKATGRANPARKRNFALQLFPTAELYIFLDSDAWPEEGWVESFLQLYEQEGTAPAFGGPNFSLNRSADRSVEYALCSFLVSPATWQAKYSSSHNLWLNYLPSCNLALRGEVFRQLKGFDESLNFGEDMDLCDRIRKNYGRILYSPKPVIRHYTREMIRPFFRQKFTYGYSLLRLFKKHVKAWFYPFCFILLFILPIVFIISFIFLNVHDFLVFILYLCCFGLFFMLIESFRVCRSLRATPGTFMAIMVGSTALFSGAFCAFFGNLNNK